MVFAKTARDVRKTTGAAAHGLQLPGGSGLRARPALGACAVVLLLFAVLAMGLLLPGAQGRALAAKTSVSTQSEDVTLGATRAAIAALPSDPRVLIRDTDNGTVSSAATLYNALPDTLKKKLTDDERLRLARCAIIVLPSDPFLVTSDCKRAIAMAQSIVDSLPATLQAELDSDEDGKTASSSRSYGRYLENDAWALDSLKVVNNATGLAPGTDTGKVTSTSSLGKSNSRRSLSFTVKSVRVVDGQAFALVEHSSDTSETLRLGGVNYSYMQISGSDRSCYEIPVNLNSTFHFSVKGKDATTATDAISYEMTVQADEFSMLPDEVDGQDGEDSGDSPGSEAGDDSGSDSGKSNNDNNNDNNDGNGGNKGGKNSKNEDDGGNGNKGDGNNGNNGDNNGKGNNGNGNNNGDGNNGGNGGGNSGNGNDGGSGNGSGNLNPGTQPRTPAASNAGNLASLVNSGATGSGGSSTTGNAKSSANAAAKTTSAAANSAFGGSTAAGDDSGASVKELALGLSADGTASARSVDLSPAIAGGVLLCISLGALAFVLRFVRRESAL